jgi:acylphosphatase
VGFRAFARRAAQRHGVAGYARNCTDGSVQVEAEASPDDLRAFLEELRRGPAHATVRQVQEQPTTQATLPAPFSIAF